MRIIGVDLYARQQTIAILAGSGLVRRGGWHRRPRRSLHREKRRFRLGSRGWCDPRDVL